MREALGQMLPLALAMAFSPPPIIAVVVMLVGPRARVSGVAFVVGWIAGISILGAVVLAIAGPAGASDNGEPSTWLSVLKLVLGLALALLAVWKWRGRPAGDGDPSSPGWMAAIERFGPIKAAGLGVALSAVNPKNVLLILGAAATEAQTGISAGRQAIVWAIFVLFATAGVAAPVVLYQALGERAPRLLERLKAWMVRNSTAVTAVLCLVIGVVLIGDSLSGLTS